MQTRRRLTASLAAVLAVASAGVSGPSNAQGSSGTIVRLSMKSDGTEGAAAGAGEMSDDGRFVVIASGDDLIVGDEDGDGADDEGGGSFLLNVETHAYSRINRLVPYYSLSGDGSLGVFAQNDCPCGDPLGPGVFAQELGTKNVRRLTQQSAVEGSTGGPQISTDGSTVAFVQIPSQGDFSSAALYTVSSNGGAPKLVHQYPAGFSRFYFDLSVDGRFVAFQTSDEGIDPSYNNGVDDVFVKDMIEGSTEMVSLDSDGTNRYAFSQYPLISGDGRYVLFQSAANFAGLKPLLQDRVYRKDRQTKKIRLVSRNAKGAAVWSHLRAYSSDGTVVAFDNLDTDVTLFRNITTGAVEPIVEGRNVDSPDLSSDGSKILFASTESGIVPGDTNATWDVFLKTQYPQCPGFLGSVDQQQECLPLELIGLEVTQGIQNLLNEVPLIRDRPTFVRAHVRSPSGERDPFDVSAARLVGRAGDGTTLPGSPLKPKDGSITIPDASVKKRNSGDIRFKLPIQWARDTIELEFVWDSLGIECSEAASTHSDCRATAVFEPAPSIEVAFVPVIYKNSKGITSVPEEKDFRKAADQIMALFPVPGVKWSVSTREVRIGSWQYFPDSDRQWEKLAEQVNDIRKDKCGSCKSYWIGLLLRPPVSLKTTGMAHDIPGDAAVAILEQTGVVAHELSHLAGLEHPNQCQESSGFEGYPYADGKMSPTAVGDEAFYGFDNRDQSTVSATSSHDLMCYDTPRWISDWSYDKIRDALAARFKPV